MALVNLRQNSLSHVLESYTFQFHQNTQGYEGASCTEKIKKRLFQRIE